MIVCVCVKKWNLQHLLTTSDNCLWIWRPGLGDNTKLQTPVAPNAPMSHHVAACRIEDMSIEGECHIVLKLKSCHMCLLKSDLKENSHEVQ